MSVTKEPCDCLNVCGDDPRVAKGLVTPCSTQVALSVTEAIEIIERQKRELEGWRLKINQRGYEMQIDALTAECDADARRLDWIECRAMNGKVEIARSIMKTGYEFGIHAGSGMSCYVKTGTLRETLDMVIAKDTIK